jgi:hypothetical protein
MMASGSSLRAPARALFAVLLAIPLLAARSRADATVDAGAPAQVISPLHTSVTVPITVTRDDATPMLGFHVRLSVSNELAVSGGTAGITEGTFLSQGGTPTSYQVLDYGDGNYVVDAVVLGSNHCRTETAGTLLNLLLTRRDGSVLLGPGSVTVVSDTLRDCSNALIASSPGTAATVDIDFEPPSVALSSPHGGESWAAGSVNAITWLASDGSGLAPDGVDLEYSSDGGSSWNPIASSQPNSGSFAWTLPALASADARVRVIVRDVFGNVASDASATSFSIVVGTSVAAGSSANPSALGGSVSLTATLTPSSATGSVEFFDGPTSLGSAPVVAGVASLAVSSLTMGTHAITASFSGTGGYASSTSPSYSQEIRASIVASAGANGTVAPSGTTLYALGASATYTLTPSGGYHVATLSVDGGAQPVTPGVMTYTFTSIAANHTLDATFASNPAVPPISALSAAQVKVGGDDDGTTRIRVSWPDVPAGSTVSLYRAGFGNYPEYDDAPGAGAAPTAPSWPPTAPWTPVTLSSMGSSGGITSGTDETAARDFFYYAAFVTDAFSSVSPASNVTSGTLDYFLGDVSGGASAGAGDNEVDIADISLLGAHYGISGAAVAAVSYLDVGPTTDFSVNARPTTDNRIDFEDLVMFALNYGTTQGAPAAARPALAVAAGPSRLSLATEEAAGSTLEARVSLNGAGDAHAVSVRLSWNASVVEPLKVTAGDLALLQGGVVMSPAAGAFDAAVLGARRQGFAGEGVLASVTFRRHSAGDPAIAIGAIVARDAANQAVSIERGLRAPAVPGVTAFAGARPNPFRGSTDLAFSLSTPGAVELSLVSVDGRRVRTLVHEWREAGEYRERWDGLDADGRRAAPGIYFARLVTPRGQFVRRTVRIE